MPVRIGFPLVDPDTLVWVDTARQSSDPGFVRYNNTRLKSDTPTTYPLLNHHLLRLAKRGAVSLYGSDQLIQGQVLLIKNDSFGLALELGDHYYLTNAQKDVPGVLLSGIVNLSSGEAGRLNDPTSVRRKAGLASQANASLILVKQDCAPELGEILPVRGELPADGGDIAARDAPGLYSLTVDATGRFKYGTSRPWWEYVGVSLGLLRREALDKVPSWYTFSGPLVRTKYQEELELAISRSASGGSRVLTVHGAGGTGKTRISCEAAVAVSHTFPGGIHMSSPRRPIDSQGALLAMLAQAVLGEAAGEGEGAYRELARSLSTARTLLILDNFELVRRELAARLVANLTSDCANLTVLVATQEQLGLVGIEQLFPVDPGLASVEAVELFEARARLVRPQWRATEAERGMVRTITDAVERIPLAVELVAAWFDRLPLAKLVSVLTVNRETLLQLPPGATAPVERHASMRSCVDWSFRMLTPDERRALAAFSLFAETGSASALGAIIGETAERGAEILQSLARRALIHEAHRTEDEVHYRTHGYIRNFAHDALSRISDSKLFRSRFVSYFAERRNDRLAIRRELSNFVQAARHADGLAADSEVIHLAHAVRWPLQYARLWQDWRDVELLALNRLTRGPKDSPQRMFEVLGDLAAAYRFLGDIEAADGYYQRALAIAIRRLGPRQEMAIRLQYASLLSVLGKHEEALAMAERARELAGAVQDKDVIPRAQLKIAKVSRSAGQWERARMYAETSAVRATQAHRNRDAIHARLVIADAFENLGSLPAAEDEYNAILAESPMNWKARAHLAGVVSAAGRHGEAHDLLDQVFKQVERPGKEYVEPRLVARQKRARVLANEGRVEEAVSTYEDSVRLAVSEGEHHTAALHLDKQGRVLKDAGQLDRARQALQRSLAIATEHAFRADAAKIAANLSEVEKLIQNGSAATGKDNQE